MKKIRKIRILDLCPTWPVSSSSSSCWYL